MELLPVHPSFLESIHKRQQKTLDGLGMTFIGPKTCWSWRVHLPSTQHCLFQSSAEDDCAASCKAMQMPGLTLHMVAAPQKCQNHLPLTLLVTMVKMICINRTRRAPEVAMGMQ